MSIKIIVSSSRQLLKIWHAGIDDLLRVQPQLRAATKAAEEAVGFAGGARVVDPKNLLSTIKAAQNTFKMGDVLPTQMTVQGAGRAIKQAAKNQPKPKVRIANPHQSAKAKAKKAGFKGNTRKETKY